MGSWRDMGVSRVGLWAVGFVGVRMAPLMRSLRGVRAVLRFVLVLGPLLVCVIDVVSFSVVDPFVFLLMHSVFLYARTGVFVFIFCWCSFR